MSLFLSNSSAVFEQDKEKKNELNCSRDFSSFQKVLDSVYHHYEMGKGTKLCAYILLISADNRAF